MKIEKLKDNIRPSSYHPVRLKEMGNVTEIMYQSSKNTKCFIRKIDKDNYVDIRDGQIYEFSHINNRSEDLNSVAKSLGVGRDLINTNVSDVRFCRWVTLTYADNMMDSNKLLSDFRNYNTRLRKIVGHYEYITCAEPQGRGAWHMHLLMIFNKVAPFIPSDVISGAWKQGFIKIKRINDTVDNLGVYLTAYLSDVELSDAIVNGINIDGLDVVEKDVEDDDTGEILKKRYVKGARLFMYPRQFHIFRWSKGIVKPVITEVDNETAEKKVSVASLTFEKTISLTDESNGYAKTINYRYYNSIRKENQ